MKQISLRIQTQLQNDIGSLVVYITEHFLKLFSVFFPLCTFLKSTKYNSSYFFLILASIKKYPENEATTFLTRLLLRLHQSEFAVPCQNQSSVSILM